MATDLVLLQITKRLLKKYLSKNNEESQIDDEIDIDNDFDETEFYFNQVVENFSEHLLIDSEEHCIGKPNLEQKIQNGLTMIISMNQIMRKRRQLKL